MPPDRKVIAASLAPDVVRALDDIRRRETRTRSSQIAHYVRQGLARDGVDVDTVADERGDRLPDGARR